MIEKSHRLGVFQDGRSIEQFDSCTSPDGADERVRPIFEEFCGRVIAVTE